VQWTLLVESFGPWPADTKEEGSYYEEETIEDKEIVALDKG